MHRSHGGKCQLISFFPFISIIFANGRNRSRPEGLFPPSGPSSGFLCFSLCFSSGWNRTPPLFMGQRLLPPSIPPSLPLMRGAGQGALIPDWPAVCIPSLLVGHGEAPGPLRSLGREVNRQQKDGERQGGRETQRSWAVPRVFSPINNWGRGKMGTSSLPIVANEETAVTSWVPPHRSASWLSVASSSENKANKKKKGIKFWTERVLVCLFLFILGRGEGGLSLAHPDFFWATAMESPTKEIEEFESTALKYLQPEQIEKIWLRLRGLWVYLLSFSFQQAHVCLCIFTCQICQKVSVRAWRRPSRELALSHIYLLWV